MDIARARKKAVENNRTHEFDMTVALTPRKAYRIGKIFGKEVQEHDLDAQKILFEITSRRQEWQLDETDTLRQALYKGAKAAWTEADPDEQRADRNMADTVSAIVTANEQSQGAYSSVPYSFDDGLESQLWPQIPAFAGFHGPHADTPEDKAAFDRGAELGRFLMDIWRMAFAKGSC